PLEDRWMPAIQLTYAGTGGALSLDEVSTGSDNVTISELTTGTLTIDLNGATFDAGSTTAASGLNYEVAGDPANSTFATVDISSANAITSLSANLGDNDDTLAIGFSQGVGDVSLDGQNGNDTITLNALTLAGNLTVATERLNLNGDVFTDGPVDFSNVNAAVVTASPVTIDTEQGDDGAGGGFTPPPTPPPR